ncbi:MAG: hypothetical protein KME59_18815 [Trichormus sp. ATA11-4-KO1]|jgi:hypothetical protein|nr:hypothetical protein [Trichormus sp. ATA11-4-KO1]
MSKTSRRSSGKAGLNQRIVLCTGDKGGVGKSIVARFLLNMYLANDIDVLAYDCDPHNPQLWRHYNRVVPGGVKTIKFNQRGVRDVLQNDLSTLAPVVALMDLPSGVGEYFRDFVQDITDADLGYRITMVSVLGRGKESIIQLKRLMEFCGNQVDYVVVRNLYWSEDEEDEKAFSKYNESKTRQSVLELGAIELNFRRLFEWVYDKIDELDASFTEAVNYDINKIGIANKSRLSTWIPKQELEMMKGGSFLGLSGAKTRVEDNSM